MPIRTALIACVLVLGTLAAVTSASAGDPNPGLAQAATQQEIGSNPGNDSPPTTVPWQQQQSQDQQNIYGSAGDEQGSADNGHDMDDEGGH